MFRPPNQSRTICLIQPDVLYQIAINHEIRIQV